MSSGKGSGSSESWVAQALAGIAMQINKEVDPVRKLFLSQLRDVLSGNLYGKGAIPLIQSGVRAARQGAGQAYIGTEGALESSGAARSPFAAAILGMVQERGNEAVADVPIQIAEGYLGQAGSLITGLGSQAIGGLGAAIQGTMRRNESASGFDIGSLLGGAGGLLSAMGGTSGLLAGIGGAGGLLAAV